MPSYAELELHALLIKSNHHLQIFKYHANLSDSIALSSTSQISAEAPTVDFHVSNILDSINQGDGLPRDPDSILHLYRLENHLSQILLKDHNC